MIIEYYIDENDFLIHQLYGASKSDLVKRQRKRNKVIVPIVYAVLGLLLWYITGSSTYGIAFFILVVLWFFIYPLWEQRHYTRFYARWIKENYKERFEKTTVVEFYDDFLIAKDNGSESKVSTTEIKEIDEIPAMLFIKLKNGHWYIFPKNKIKNIDDLIIRLKQIATNLNIPYNIDEKWKWK